MSIINDTDITNLWARVHNIREIRGTPEYELARAEGMQIASQKQGQALIELAHIKALRKATEDYVAGLKQKEQALESYLQAAIEITDNPDYNIKGEVGTLSTRETSGVSLSDKGAFIQTISRESFAALTKSPEISSVTAEGIYQVYVLPVADAVASFFNKAVTQDAVREYVADKSPEALEDFLTRAGLTPFTKHTVVFKPKKGK